MTDVHVIDREAARRASQKLSAWVSGILAEAAEKAALNPVVFERAFGIECQHHYGITTHPFTAKTSIAEMVYEHVRGWHPPREGGYGLTDDNHTWRVEHKPEGWSRLVVVKNELSPWFLIKPSWLDDGPGTTWFTQEFRIATPAKIEFEIAYNEKRIAECRADVERQRDTIRGRKARATYESIIREHERLIRVALKRWPEFQREPQ